ncbi:MAG: DsrE family protein [Pseudomonadota bacterium]
METLIIINDGPYGSERAYQALRLADVLLKVENDLELNVFLLGDGVSCAKKGQVTPDGYYNIERMLKPIVKRGNVIACQTCMDARGLTEEDMMEGVRKTRLGELAQATLEADKVLVF